MTRLNRRRLLQSLGALGAGSTLAGVASAAPRDVTSMRISGYDLIPVRVPMADHLREAWVASWTQQERAQTYFTPIFVRLHSDVGLTGIGEAKMNRAQAEAVLKGMVGHSPWEFVQNDDIRGVLIAVYDLLGKATGLPVARLLSPHPRDRITQTWWSQCFPPALMASEAKRGVSSGYRVHKIKIRPWQDPIEQVRAICAAVPSDYKIWGDANFWWAAENPWKDRSIWGGSVDGALHTIRKLAQFPNFFAIESPVGRHDMNAYRQLKRKVPLRIAEHIDGADPMPYIREDLLDAFITGNQRLGTTFTELAAAAKTAGIRLWVEHSIDNGIAQVFQAQQGASFPAVEYCISITHCLEDDCMQEAFVVEDGYYKLPQKPGLGVSLDESALEKYRTA